MRGPPAEGQTGGPNDRPPARNPLPKGYCVPGRLEWAVTFTELLETCRQSGSFTITLQTSEGRVTARLQADILRLTVIPIRQRQQLRHQPGDVAERAFTGFINHFFKGWIAQLIAFLTIKGIGYAIEIVTAGLPDIVGREFITQDGLDLFLTVQMDTWPRQYCYVVGPAKAR